MNIKYKNQLYPLIIKQEEGHEIFHSIAKDIGNDDYWLLEFDSGKGVIILEPIPGHEVEVMK